MAGGRGGDPAAGVANRSGKDKTFTGNTKFQTRAQHLSASSATQNIKD